MSEKKFVIWTEQDGKTLRLIKEVDENVRFDPKKISKFKLIKSILFNRGFTWKLEGTIKYALTWHETFRGEGAADVILFEHEDIWK